MPRNRLPASDNVQRLNLTDQVYDTLKRQIVQRQLLPGAKLDLGVLALQMGVSRMPVVDALNRLEMESLIVRRDRVGSFVARLSVQDFVDIFQARQMVETWAIDPIAATITPAHRIALRRTLEESKKLLEGVTDKTFDYRQYLIFDERFHVALIGLCGNQKIINWYASLNAHIQIGRVYSLRVLDRCRGAVKEHDAILDAIEAHDVVKAKAAISQHLEESHLGIMTILEERGGDL